jgi:hypothetical protein
MNIEDIEIGERVIAPYGEGRIEDIESPVFGKGMALIRYDCNVFGFDTPRTERDYTEWHHASELTPAE